MGDWYLETYEKRGTRPTRQWIETDWAKVAEHIREDKQKPDQTLRVKPPIDATTQELHELEQFGVQRIFP